MCADSGAGTPKALEVHVSDHKVLSCDIQLEDRNTKAGYLTRGPSWVLPPGLDKEQWKQWKQLLRDTWARSPSVRSSFHCHARIDFLGYHGDG